MEGISRMLIQKSQENEILENLEEDFRSLSNLETSLTLEINNYQFGQLTENSNGRIRSP